MLHQITACSDFCLLAAWLMSHVLWISTIESAMSGSLQALDRATGLTRAPFEPIGACSVKIKVSLPILYAHRDAY